MFGAYIHKTLLRCYHTAWYELSVTPKYVFSKFCQSMYVRHDDATCNPVTHTRTHTHTHTHAHTRTHTHTHAHTHAHTHMHTHMHTHTHARTHAHTHTCTHTHMHTHTHAHTHTCHACISSMLLLQVHAEHRVMIMSLEPLWHFHGPMKPAYS